MNYLLVDEWMRRAGFMGHLVFQVDCVFSFFPPFRNSLMLLLNGIKKSSAERERALI